jgi:hypothetical protein
MLHASETRRNSRVRLVTTTVSPGRTEFASNKAPGLVSKDFLYALLPPSIITPGLSQFEAEAKTRFVDVQ